MTAAKTDVGVIVPEEQKTQKLLATFNDKLMAAYEWVQEWKKAESTFSLKSRYALGLYVKEIVEDDEENNGSTYGLNAFGRLSDALHEDKSLMHASVRFVHTYTADQVDALCSIRRPDGESVSWSHVRLLIQVEPAAAREELLARCVAECWTSTQLGHVIISVKNGQGVNKGQGGRPLARPKSLKSLLEQVGTFTEKINKRAPIWTAPEGSPAAMAADLTLSQVDEALLNDLVLKRNNCDQAIHNLSTTKRELDKAIARVQRTLEKKLSSGAAQITGGDDDDEGEEEEVVAVGRRQAVAA